MTRNNKKDNIQKNNKKNIKKLQDLNLLDRFLFAQATEDPVILRYILEILLGKEIFLKELPQTNFNELNSVYVIIIAPFDLFGYGLYQYTFENKCKEVPELSLGDGATRIIFNTHGTNDAKTRPELIELLHYIENTTEEVSEQCQSDKIKEMQKRIRAIKSSEEVGVKYMQAWEELAETKNEGRKEGREEGELIGTTKKLIQLVCKKLVKGKSPEDIADILEEDLSLIEELCEAAKKCDDLTDYDQIFEIWREDNFPLSEEDSD